MASLSALRDRLRLELGDLAHSFEASVDGNDVLDRFDLPVSLVKEGSLVVFNGATPLVEGDDYSVDYQDGVLTMATAPVTGETVNVQGYHFDTFLDSTLDMFIETAFGQHTANQKNSLGLPLTLADLPAIEEYLVVLLAEIEALWAMATEAARGFDISTPEGVNIPGGQVYQQLLGIISSRQAQYSELCSKLGVGLDRIEMFTLRRVSRITGRLVPVYKPLEYDDYLLPYTPISGPVGTTVIITGQYFTSVTAVKFNNTDAVFTVIDDHTISAVVPAGATTGPLHVISPGGTITTATVFTVGQLAPQLNQGGYLRVRPKIDPLG